MNTNDKHQELAKEIAIKFNSLPGVRAVALAGSSTGIIYDPKSDIDLYVFTQKQIPLDIRRDIVQKHHAHPVNLDLHFWDPGDQWFDGKTGIEVDIMYWEPQWVEDQIKRRIIQHTASLGCSTCLWHTIKHSTILYDDEDWLKGLKDLCNQPYPEELRRNIIQLNYPVLRKVIPAYLNQIEKAVHRGDVVSVNHRISALLASYFDILFALNRTTHPGEKRLLKLTAELCHIQPVNMEVEIRAILHSITQPGDELITLINQLINHLDQLLFDENLLDT